MNVPVCAHDTSAGLSASVPALPEEPWETRHGRLSAPILHESEAGPVPAMPG